MGSPFLYNVRSVLSVTFFRRLPEEAPIGECELYRLWHCDSRGFAAKGVIRGVCEKSARDAFMAENDGDMATIRSGNFLDD